MSSIHLLKSTLHSASALTIKGSKSESNRLLLLQALYPEIRINNCSNSDDTVVMRQAFTNNSAVIDVHHAGTAMRFLTAYFASLPGKSTLLTGSSRMKERPIKILVDALRQMGAKIDYEGHEGFPPLRIYGQQLTKNKVQIQANVSSQYISALLLIAPKLSHGLELSLEGELTSLPYVKMTIKLLEQIGVTVIFKNKCIQIKPLKQLKTNVLTVESDWSSASYLYSLVALSELGTEINLQAYKLNSLQGDSVLAELYKQFGVITIFNEESITIKKTELLKPAFSANLIEAPDIAQTLAVTCFGLGVSCNLTGLHTLKIKETDRLSALKTELEKLGASVQITTSSLQLKARETDIQPAVIDTYNDHRMAMAFAPLSVLVSIHINNPEVVSKSYPDFWSDMEQIGIVFK